MKPFKPFATLAALKRSRSQGGLRASRRLAMEGLEVRACMSAISFYGSTSSTGSFSALETTTSSTSFQWTGSNTFGTATPAPATGGETNMPVSESAAAFGDFNGDGYQDLALGIPLADASGVEGSGAVRVLYGGPAGLDEAMTQLLHQDLDYIANRSDAGDRFGAALTAGDFNGDKIADLAVGVPGEDIVDGDGNVVEDAGAVYVFYGASSGFGPHGVDYLDGHVLIHGSKWVNSLPNLGLIMPIGGAAGATLAAGDFDGDDVDDLVIGAPHTDIKIVVEHFLKDDDVYELLNAGAVRVVYGGAGGILESFAADKDGTVITQTIGEPEEQVCQDGSGWANCVLFFKPMPVRYPESGLTGHAWWGDRLGSSLAVGDFNGDGRDDLAIGSPVDDAEFFVKEIFSDEVHSGFITDTGSVNVLYGSDSGLDVDNDQYFHQFNIWDPRVLGPQDHGSLFGSALTAGDFNGDDVDDLAIAAAGEDQRGRVHVLFGTPSKLTTDNQRLLQLDARGRISLTSGDFNGDENDDLVIGRSTKAVSGEAAAGEISLRMGHADTRFALLAERVWSQSDFGFADRPEAGDTFGAALAAADVNGDGRDDLAITVPGEDVPGDRTSVGSSYGYQDAGSVNVLYGTMPGMGLGTLGQQVWHEGPRKLYTNGTLDVGSSLFTGDEDVKTYDPGMGIDTAEESHFQPYAYVPPKPGSLIVN